MVTKEEDIMVSSKETNMGSSTILTRTTIQLILAVLFRIIIHNNSQIHSHSHISQIHPRICHHPHLYSKECLNMCRNNSLLMHKTCICRNNSLLSTQSITMIPGPFNSLLSQTFLPMPTLLSMLVVLTQPLPSLSKVYNQSYSHFH